MPFCPNCGTPNTDQADKCVACGFELSPKQKAKFKGTIMMSGIKAPTQPEPQSGAEPTAPAAPVNPPARADPPRAAPVPNVPNPPVGRSLGPKKTMLGPAAAFAPPQPAPPPEPAERPQAAEAQSRGSHDFSYAPTIQGSGPQFTPPRAAPEPRHSAEPRPSAEPSALGGAGTASGSNFGQPSSPGYAGRFSSAAIESTFPPGAPSKISPGKLLAIGCAAALALFCVASVFLYFTLGDRLRALLRGGDSGAEAAAWQASISQALAQVSALCQEDCQQAEVFFHPSMQATLLGEAKALTPPRVQKLSDPTQSKAEMLDGSGDEQIATKLGLDPQQCARVSAQSAKVVSCSVPDPGGKPTVLRIVHLSGLSSL